MRIAVIGGGAAGLVTAYLLDQAHDVHVFERQSILGGNVRTLGGNVACSGLEEGVISENGVAWFHESTSPNMHRLLDELGIEYGSKLLDSSIILANGHHCHISALDCLNHLDWEALWRERDDLSEVVRETLSLVRRTQGLSNADLNGVPLETYLDGLGPLVAQWIRGLVAAALSVPFSQVGQFPSDVIIPLIRNWLRDRHATVLPGGIFSYMQEILNQIHPKVHLDVQVESVRRRDGFVEVTLPERCEVFDRVVIATTPECAFQLLLDPSPAEVRWLSRWRDISYRTIAHVSETFYTERNIRFRTQCDCFERPEQGSVGYNCSLNDFYEIKSDRLYSFAAHLDEWIDEDCALDTQEHVAPIFHIDSTVHRHEIREANGQNGTYYVGGYLVDGLHEGAVTTAMEVSEKLGGRTLESKYRCSPSDW